MSSALFRQPPPRQCGEFLSSSPSSSVLSTDEVAKWFDAIWTGSAFGGTSKQSLSSSSSVSSYLSALDCLGIPSSKTVSGAMYAVLFPPLPPWLATVCSLCRIIAAMIIAPILLIALLDLAEYAVIRTLGLQRRRVRVKPTTSTLAPRLLLSPAQLRSGDAGNPAQAPLLSTGAYDAETLLRHRARSLSTASAEAIEEWQRTGGSFARVAEVRQAASSAASSPEGSNTPLGGKPLGSYFEATLKTSPSMARSPANAEDHSEGRRVSLSESDAEGEEDGRSDTLSLTTDLGGGQQPRRRKMRRSQFDFTPLKEKPSFHWSQDSLGRPSG